MTDQEKCEAAKASVLRQIAKSDATNVEAFGAGYAIGLEIVPMGNSRARVNLSISADVDALLRSARG